MAIFYLANGLWPGVFLIVTLLSLGSALTMLTARNLRGHTAWEDACFPILWLSWGQVENLLWSFQLQLVIPVVLIALIFWNRTRANRTSGPSQELVTSVSILLMTLCGGNGVLAALPFLVVAIAGFISFRNKNGSIEERWYSLLSTLIIIAAISVCVACFVGLLAAHQPGGNSADGLTRLATLVAFLSMSWGPICGDSWSLGGLVFLVLTAVASWYSMAVVRRMPSHKQFSTVALCAIAGVLLQAMAIGYARSAEGVAGGLQSRYQTILLPGMFAIWLLPATITEIGLRRKIQISLLIVSMVTLCNVPYGLRYAQSFGSRRAAFLQDLNQGVPQIVLALRYHSHPFGLFAPNASYLNDNFTMLQRVKSPPFDRMTTSPKTRLLTMPCDEVRVGPDGSLLLPPATELQAVQYQFAFQGPPQVVEVTVGWSEESDAAEANLQFLTAQFSMQDGGFIQHTESVMRKVRNLRISVKGNNRSRFLLAGLRLAISER